MSNDPISIEYLITSIAYILVNVSGDEVQGFALNTVINVLQYYEFQINRSLQPDQPDESNVFNHIQFIDISLVYFQSQKHS